MFYVLSKILDLLVAPLTWVLALILLGAFARRTGVRVGALGCAFALLFICSLQPVANSFFRAAELPAERTYRDDVTYDAVIVLGGFVDGSATASAGVPSYNGNIERLLTAYDLLRTGHAKTAILSGGAVQGEVNEGEVMATHLSAWGIARDRLLVEGTSRNTRENAVESAKIARNRQLKTLLLVTSAFHMPRAHGCFRAKDVALDVDTLPVDFRTYDPARDSSPWAPRAAALEDTSAAIRERFGRLVYRARGFSG